MLYFKVAKSRIFLLIGLIVVDLVLAGFWVQAMWQKTAILDTRQKIIRTKNTFQNELKKFALDHARIAKLKVFEHGGGEVTKALLVAATKCQVSISAVDSSADKLDIAVLGRYSELMSFWRAFFTTEEASGVAVQEIGLKKKSNVLLLKATLLIYPFGYQKQSDNFNYVFFRDPFVLGKPIRPVGLNIWPVKRLKIIGFIKINNEKTALVMDPNHEIYKVSIGGKVGLERKNVWELKNN